MLCYNFHHPHRSLWLKACDGTFKSRTPAMAIGIAKHPLSIEEILVTEVVATAFITKPTLASFGSRFRRPGAP